MSELRYPFSEIPAPGGTILIRDGLHWARMPLPIDLNHINVYLLEDGDALWIVDTGIAGEEGRTLWTQILQEQFPGRPVRDVLCTHMHMDHIGQAGWLCREHDAPLHMSRGEFLSNLAYRGGSDAFREQARAFYSRSGVGEEVMQILTGGRAAGGRGGAGNRAVEPLPASFRCLREDRSLTIGEYEWRIMVGRGHSPEHVCLYSDEHRILLAGDQVLPRITPNISVLPLEPEADPLADWFDSLEHFAQLPEDTLVLPAHNEPFYGLHERLKQIRDHHLEQLETLRADCAEPQSVRDLLPRLFRRKLTPMQTLLGLGECLAHLHFLMHKGEMARELSAEGLYLYQSAG